MKKILLFIAFVFLFNSKANAQTQSYIPMAIDSAYWLVESSYIPTGGPPIPEYFYHLYGTNGDTVVNNLTYKKTFYYRIDSSGSLQGELIALLRDDTLARQVYMINLVIPNNIYNYHGCAFECPMNSEFILYDFSLNTTADTLYNCTNSFGYATAYDTSHQLMYDKFRKVILTSSPNSINFEWYEGIGGQTSPFSRFGNGYLGGLPNYTLHDYCVGNLKDCNLWGLFSSTANLTEDLNLKIFPNPAKNVLNIELATFQGVEVAIFNALGQRVQTEKLSTFNTSILLENQVNGLYYLQFTRYNQVLKTEKILIIK